MPRKERLPPNVSSFVDRHGKRRYRYRGKGRAFYLREHPNSAAGKAELATKLAEQDNPPSRYAQGTVGWTAQRYFASPAFTGSKGADTERNARRILEPFTERFATDRIADFRFDHIETILAEAAVQRIVAGRKRGGPSAANNLRGELKPFFDYAFKLLAIEKINPVTQAAKIKVPKGGFYSWTEADIAQYRARWPLGTAARLCAEIALWTWQRRADVSKFGPAQLRDGKFCYTQGKTGKELWLPAAPQLLAAIDAMPVVGTSSFLVNDYGRPFTVAGLGNKFREWCDEADLPRCTLHGLRKAGARRAAEHGASNQMLKGAGGWSGDAEVGLYTAAVEQERMAEQALRPVIESDR